MTPRPAGLGRRALAALIDIAVLLVLLVVLAALAGETEAGDGSFSVSLEGAAALVYFASALAYYAVFEAVTGRTIGKLALGLRVVSLDGSPAGTGQVLLRTALRIVDGILVYLVGFVCALATGRDRRARIGDLAAKTVVVGRG